MWEQNMFKMINDQKLNLAGFNVLTRLLSTSTQGEVQVSHTDGDI